MFFDDNCKDNVRKIGSESNQDNNGKSANNGTKSVKDQITETKQVLKQKNEYMEELLKLQNEINKSNAEKRAILSIQKYNIEQFQAKNVEIRNKAKAIFSIFSECFDYFNNNKKKYEEEEIQCDKTILRLNYEATNNKRKLNGLVKSINRFKKVIENKTCEENKIKSEIELMKTLNVYYDSEQSLLQDITVDDFYEESIRMKISQLRYEVADLENEYQKMSEECHRITIDQTQCSEDLKIKEIDIRCHDIETECSVISESLNVLKIKEANTTDTLNRLKETEESLKEEMETTAQTYAEIERNELDQVTQFNNAMDNLDMEINKTENNYVSVKEKLSGMHQIADQLDDSTSEVESNINQLSIELKNVENALIKLPSATYFDEQNVSLTQETQNTLQEINSLENIVKQNEKNLDGIQQAIKECKTSSETEISEIEQAQLIEKEQVKNDLINIEATKADLEAKAKRAEINTANLQLENGQLGENRNKMIERIETCEKEIEDSKKTLAIYEIKIAEIKQKIANKIKPPAAVFNKLIKPRLQNSIFSSKSIKPIQLPSNKNTLMNTKETSKTMNLSRKRNWDSDSSAELDTVNFQEIIKRNTRNILKLKDTANSSRKSH